MAEILPFAGLRYSLTEGKDLSLVVAPPYDVIGPELQETLYRRHPHNIVRLIKGKGENFYEDARHLLETWEKEGILVRDPSPCIYLYRHRFRLSKDSPRKTRRGFMALARLEDFGSGKVLPHERTLSAPKDDRLRLLEMTNANLCPIFALYSHGDLDALLADMMGKKPDNSATDDDGMEHALWKLTDTKAIETIKSMIKDRSFLIADGHHRYEAAMIHRDKQREKLSAGTGTTQVQAGPHEYVMMYFTSMEGKGLSILPTHRILSGLTSFDREGYLTRIEKLFSVMEFPLSGGETWAREMLVEGLKKIGSKTRAFGLIFHKDRAYYLLAMKEREFLSDAVREKFAGMSAPLLDLDVSVLHTYLLPEFVGGETPHLEYVHRVEEAVGAVTEGKGQAAFLLNPTKIAQIARVAEAGEVMPPKSTYFYPKLLSGLAIRSLDS